ncbi:hypothetical protein BN7_131 [Wickerhamomyces ciferrii]|uniref:Uncharacterized protein n=1 Tax=Wickerhamomyces ciferrii (strain ATCC 14091 / BCRC 22168 / CBS 111 / JCM 3599 / NBRC 0793 / NRRL Y-1031 F-60-10) TaxID=1206466 RepID=K0KHE6_WICCF|nr:uncharacterized protein BN7_131 [Wickerhamomyces ciferrii]CCH40598.1 hypothetical protein BN7_131 [Wickerhamomyces ciferrii]
MSGEIPHGVKYKDILEDENELIDVKMLVRLFNSVAPKLETLLREANRDYIRTWNRVKQELQNLGDTREADRLIKGIDQVYHRRYFGFIKNIESFKDVSEKLATRIDSHIQVDEKEFLGLIMQSRSLVPSIMELFKDVDKLEDDINSMFREVIKFLEEVSYQYTSLHRNATINQLERDGTQQLKTT